MSEWECAADGLVVTSTAAAGGCAEKQRPCISMRLCRQSPAAMRANPGFERISTECIKLALQLMQAFQSSHARIEPIGRLDEQRVGADG